MATVGQTVAGICAVALLSTPAFGQTYSCGDPSSGHCYGVASWREQAQYFGAWADILTVAMICPSGCGGFVDDEIWLVDDDSTTGCTTNGFGQCWVEAGYFYTDGSGNAQLFWADARPRMSSTFNLHILGSADAAGGTDHFVIIEDGRGAPGIYQVYVFNDSHSVGYNGTSTSNPMTGHRIDIGQELAGTMSASAGDAYFSENIWAVQALGSDFTFWYNRQTDEGNVTSQGPPFALWTINPSSPPPPEGGQFMTHCC